SSHATTTPSHHRCRFNFTAGPYQCEGDDQYNGGQLQQCLPAEGMAFHRPYATLIISQQHTLLPESLQQRLDLVVLKLNFSVEYDFEVG
ncbi:MAG: hypothetical protein O2820_23455, partial [Planctomycetota bacterium]|nr:hypothetical protein [Planctomycetota bacterium]MDA1252172.1 hypothetical protein [Planctomycetota bacterium]